MIVGHDQNGAGVVLQVAFQPFHAFRIEVVGRFVQQHDVRLGKQDGSQQNAHFPTAGKHVAGFVKIALAEAEPFEDLFGPGFKGVSVAGGKFGRRLRIAARKLAVFARVGLNL